MSSSAVPASGSAASKQKPSELRLRHPHGDDASKPAGSVGTSHSGDTSRDLKSHDEHSKADDDHSDPKPAKTYGRTPDGTGMQ
jgi:hypothetical protein